LCEGEGEDSDWKLEDGSEAGEEWDQSNDAVEAAGKFENELETIDWSFHGDAVGPAFDTEEGT